MGYFPSGYGEMIVRYGIDGDDEDKTVSMGFSSALGNDEPSLSAAAAEFRTEWLAALHAAGASSMFTPWRLRGFRWSFRVGSDVHEGENPTELVGTASADSPVTHTALFIKKRSGLAGAGNKGRMFLPCWGIQDSDIDPAGTVDSTEVDDFQTRFDNFATACAAGDVNLVILHGLIQSENPSPPPKYLYAIPTDPPVLLTSFVVASKVATQRRRLNR